MTLRITKESDRIEVANITTTIYAPPGIGKTTLAFTADKPLLLDFDQGAYRAANRKDTVQVAGWPDVAGITAGDLAGYNTLILDTAGRALDALTADIIRRNPKMGRGGSLTLQGYGQLKSEFIAFTKQVRGFGKDVILLTHMDEQRSGDEIVERLDVQGGSKNEIYKASDAMARLAIREGKRVLNFSPTDTAFGKNPAQLEPLLVPDVSVDGRFLAGVIATIKERLNAMTAEQTEIAKKLEAWHIAVADCIEADEFNGLLKKLETLDEDVRENAKRILWHAAQGKVEFNKKAGKFEGKKAA